MGLELDGSHRAVFVFVEFHSLPCQQANPLARNSLRTHRREPGSHPQELAAGASGCGAANARCTRQSKYPVAAPAGIASHHPARTTTIGPTSRNESSHAPMLCCLFSTRKPHAPSAPISAGARIAPASAQWIGVLHFSSAIIRRSRNAPIRIGKSTENESVKIKKQNAKNISRPLRNSRELPEVLDPNCKTHEKAAADPGREVIDQAASPRHILGRPCWSISFWLTLPGQILRWMLGKSVQTFTPQK